MMLESGAELISKWGQLLCIYSPCGSIYKPDNASLFCLLKIRILSVLSSVLLYSCHMKKIDPVICFKISLIPFPFQICIPQIVGNVNQSICFLLVAWFPEYVNCYFLQGDKAGLLVSFLMISLFILSFILSQYYICTGLYPLFTFICLEVLFSFFSRQLKAKCTDHYALILWRSIS